MRKLSLKKSEAYTKFVYTKQSDPMFVNLHPSSVLCTLRELNPKQVYTSATYISVQTEEYDSSAYTQLSRKLPL